MTEQSIVFDRAAGFYDQTRGFPDGTEQDVAQLFQQVGSITTTTHIVEPGIGTGRIALPLTKHTGAHVFGVDLSTAMMEQLRAKQTDENIYLVAGDAMVLPFLDNCFDNAIVTHVFHLVADWKEALNEIGRVLKPDGALLFSWAEFDSNPIQDVWTTIHGANSQHRYERFRGTDFLHRSGWQLAGETGQVAYTVKRTPAQLIESLENRVWSSTWSMSDEVVREGVEKLQDVSETIGGVDATYELTTHFHVAPFKPPA